VSMSRSWGSSVGGRWGQWAIDDGYPQWPVAHRTGGTGGGGDRGYWALCRRRKSTNESGRSWRRLWTEEKELRGVAQVLAMAVASWRPSSTPSDRGTCKDGQHRSGEQREGVGATRGGEGKQEVERQQQHSGGRGGVLHRRQRRQRSRACQRKKKRGGGPRGLVEIFKNLRDPSIK
jgi:hypothetical protein